MVLKKMVALLIFVLFLTAAGQTKNFYVDIQNGNDLNYGDNWTRSFMSISRAIQLATAGDNIYIAPGRYYELIAPISAGLNEMERLKFIGIGKGVIIDGQILRQCVNNSKNYITFENLEFINSHPTSRGAFYNSGINVEIINCKFYDNTYRGSSHYTAAAVTNTGYNLRIIKSVFYNNISFYAGNYIASSVYSTNRIDEINRCLFYGNTAYLHYAYGHSGAGVIVGDITTLQNNIFMNNTLISAQPSYAWSSTAYTCVRPYNANYLKISLNRYNNYYNNTGGDTDNFHPGENEFYVDPEFLDETNKIFYLKESSPMINQGAADGQFFSSIGPYDVSKEIGFSTNWSDWIDKDGNSLTASEYFVIEDGNLKLNKYIEATAESPVYDFGEEILITYIDLIGEIWENLKIGYKQVVDLNKQYPREIEYKFVLNSEDIDNSAWQSVVINDSLSGSGRFFKVRITLRKNAE